MQNEWTREIERLTDLLEKSEEEMLFWRHNSRRLNKENAALKAELAELRSLPVSTPCQRNIDFLDDGVTGRQWMIEKEAEHEKI